MIILQGGKSYCQRTDAELVQAAQEAYKTLTPDEIKVLELMMAEEAGLLADGGPSLQATMEAVEWKEKPVDMDTFVKDEYYLGRTCDEIYPLHLEDLKELFDRGGYQQAIWTGCIGSGKSFCASIGMCRVLYELSCMVDPHGAYHIARNTPIDLVCFSVTEELAIKVAFDYIIEKLTASPYFREKFPFKDNKKEFRFPNKIRIAARATTDTSALGMNVISGWIDEGNFMPKPGKAMKIAGEKDKAEKIYNSLRRRMKSRFERRGWLPGMMFVVSSKRRTDDFTQKLVEKSRSDRTTFVRDLSLWEAKPEHYSKKRFHVFVGDEAMPSKILQPEEVAEFRKLAETNENCLVIDVPEDFRVDFENDIDESIRDIAGIATITITPFLRRRDRIREIGRYGDAHGLKHPFSVSTFIPGRGGEFLWDQMVDEAVRPLVTGGHETYLRPKLNPDAARHGHIDPSLNGDATGIAVGHIAGYKEVVRRDARNRKEYSERAPVILVDFLLQVQAAPGEELILGDVRGLIYQLVEHGYPITFVSMDRYQSIDGIQQMNARGIKADILSVDVKPDPYDTLKVALYEGRVMYYTYEPVLGELVKLEKNHMTGKVDHPPLGSKDVADALAGLVFSLTTMQTESQHSLPFLRGLPDVMLSPADRAFVSQMDAARAGMASPPAEPPRSFPIPFLSGDDLDPGRRIG